MKAGRKQKLSANQKKGILKSKLKVIELADYYNVGRDTIYRVFNSRNKVA